MEPDFTPLDFIGAPDLSRRTINAWVEEQTNARIREFLPLGTISPLTSLVLTNAVYFDAAWKDTFPGAGTYDQGFHMLDGSVKPVKMMHRTGAYRIANAEGV